MKYTNNPLDFIRDFVSLTGMDPRGSKGSQFLQMLNEICEKQLSRLPNGADDIIDAAKPTIRLN